jgi:hypothetical protein
MIVRNCKVKWASLKNPNTTYTPRWEVNMYPPEEGVAQMEDAGIELKTDKETGEKFYKAMRNVQTKSGKELSPPVVVDRQKEPFDQLIGNGSICNIKLTVKEVNAFGQNRVKGYLDSVQVINHIPYGDGEDFDVEEGDDEF